MYLLKLNVFIFQHVRNENFVFIKKDLKFFLEKQNELYSFHSYIISRFRKRKLEMRESIRNVPREEQGEGSPSIESTVERTKTNRRRKVKKSKE